MPVNFVSVTESISIEHKNYMIKKAFKESIGNLTAS